MWVWIAIGVGSFLGLSLLVGIAMARILGEVGRRVSEMYETEVWSRVPTTRVSKDVKEQQPDEIETKSLASVG